MSGRFRRPGLLVATMAATVVATASSAGAAAGPWRVIATPNPGGDQVANIWFRAVAASGPKDAWGVGIDDVNSFRRPLVEHWDGEQWRAVHVPQPVGRQAWFNGVFQLGRTNVWAVGESSNADAQDEGEQTFIEHYDGATWTIVPSPSPAHGFGAANLLTSISGVGPTDIWAAGWDFDPGAKTIAFLLEHWDGASWTIAPSPTPIGGLDTAFGVVAIAPDDAWAVGDSALQTTKAAHWDGSAWRYVPTPSLHDGINPTNLLTGVTAASSNDVWASGYEGNVDNQNFAKPYMLHWNGSAWTLTNVPNQGGEGSLLFGTTALSSSDVWAVGQTQELNGTILTLTEHFDGADWSIVPSPSPGQIGHIKVNGLRGIARGRTSLFALGFQEFEGACCSRTLALQTN